MVAAGEGSAALAALEGLGSGVPPHVPGQLVRPGHNKVIMSHKIGHK